MLGREEKTGMLQTQLRLLLPWAALWFPWQKLRGGKMEDKEQIPVQGYDSPEL